MQPVDLSRVRTYPLAQRRNLVRLADLITPEMPPPPFDDPELDEVVERIVVARRAGRPVIWMMGAHVIKSGLSRLLIDLMQRGVVTRVAGNGAVSIHDFELALIGETSEDVANSLEDGTFGMAEETGALMHQAIREGARDSLGFGWASIYWAGMTIGRVFFGIVVDRIGSVPLVRICMGGVVCGALLIWWNISDALSFLGLALIGFSVSPLFPVLTSNTPERLGAEHAANAIGFQITAVKLGLAVIPALGGVFAEAFGLEIIGPFLFVIAIAMFLLHEATVPRKARSKGACKNPANI